jgi:polyhydroxyalkanoate synthase subunit PhaC
MTAHSVLGRHGKLSVRAYRAAPRRFASPVVLIPALINRAAILDLYDGGSLAQYLTQAGYDAYLIDWGVPGDEDRDLGLDDLLTGYLPSAIERVRADAGCEGMTLLGYCMGGTLAVVYAALQRLAPPDNLIALAAPVDFSHGGRLAQWCAPGVLDIEEVVRTFGNVPAVLIEAAFTLLRPTAKVRAALRFFDNASEPRAHQAYAALARWSDEWIPFPGRAARDWVTLFYQQNRLISGELRIGGKRVDLQRITAPVLAIAAENDEISPPASVGPLVEGVASTDRSFVVLPGGHIGLVAGRSARNVLWPAVEEWLETRSAKELR